MFKSAASSIQGSLFPPLRPFLGLPLGTGLRYSCKSLSEPLHCENDEITCVKEKVMLLKLRQENNPKKRSLPKIKTLLPFWLRSPLSEGEAKNTNNNFPLITGKSNWKKSEKVQMGCTCNAALESSSGFPGKAAHPQLSG